MSRSLSFSSNLLVREPLEEMRSEDRIYICLKEVLKTDVVTLHVPGVL